jgi:hypothetical protein
VVADKPGDDGRYRIRQRGHWDDRVGRARPDADPGGQRAAGDESTQRQTGLAVGAYGERHAEQGGDQHYQHAGSRRVAAPAEHPPGSASIGFGHVPAQASLIAWVTALVAVSAVAGLVAVAWVTARVAVPAVTGLVAVTAVAGLVAVAWVTRLATVAWVSGLAAVAWVAGLVTVPAVTVLVAVTAVARLVAVARVAALVTAVTSLIAWVADLVTAVSSLVT